ncbi:MAG: hypothetical protein NT013_09920 [Planctomycetia bacterium]|nr:hypothetical protein [Planctomycetia bacterium]
MTSEETFSWCGRHGIAYEPEGRIVTPGESYICLCIETPKSHRDLLCLTAIMAQSVFEFSREDALLSMKDWGFWGEENDGFAVKIIEAIRFSLGDKRPLIESPSHLFNCDESLELYACLLQPLICEWDCCLMPSSGQWFIDVDHDDGIRCFAKTQDSAEYLVRKFQPWRTEKVSGTVV